MCARSFGLGMSRCEQVVAGSGAAEGTRWRSPHGQSACEGRSDKRQGVGHARPYIAVAACTPEAAGRQTREETCGKPYAPYWAIWVRLRARLTTKRLRR